MYARYPAERTASRHAVAYACESLALYVNVPLSRSSTTGISRFAPQPNVCIAVAVASPSVVPCAAVSVSRPQIDGACWPTQIGRNNQLSPVLSVVSTLFVQPDPALQAPPMYTPVHTTS